MADNGQHTFRFESLTSAMSTHTTFIMENRIDPLPRIDALMDPTPDSATDVWVTDAHYTSLCLDDWYPNGTVIGMYTCEAITGQGKCQQAKVRFNNNWTDNRTWPARRDLICHELGHSLGLRHRSNTGSQTGCMPATVPTVSGYAHYTTHDKGHLNDPDHY